MIYFCIEKIKTRIKTGSWKVETKTNYQFTTS